MSEPAGGWNIEELIDRYNSVLLRVISAWSRDPAETEDILQDVWIRVHRSLGGFKSRSSIFTWLYRIAVNAAITHGRKRRPERLPPDELADPRSSLRPDRELEKEHLRQRMDAAVRKLSGRHRQVFLLRAYAELSYEEIAVSLKTTGLNARVLYHHAVNRLRAELGDKSDY